MVRSYPIQRIVLFAATSWEFNAVAAASRQVQRTRLGDYAAATWSTESTAWTVIEMGVGPANATRAAEAVLTADRWDAALSTGFAAGLRAPVGAVLLGTSVRSLYADTSSLSGLAAPLISSDPSLCEWLQAQLAPTVGSFVSTDRVIVRSAEKRDIAAQAADAVGLDMESAALAMVAQRQRIPFAVLRTVSDGVDESLPMDFNAFFGAQATVWTRLREAARAVVTPGSLPGLLRLGRQSQVAAKALTRLVERMTCAPAMPLSVSPQGAHV